MTAPEKPGLSNEEFIIKQRALVNNFGAGYRLHDEMLEALDRLEALIGQGKPTPGQIGHELRLEDGPFKVEVDDHSDDCGTVYRLFGPSTSILHKDKDYLDEMAEHHNWGWYQAILSVTGQGQEERDYTPEWVKVKFSDERYHELLDLIDSLPMPSRKGVCVNDTNLLRDYLMDSFGAIKHLASADKTQADKGDGK